MRDHKYGKIRLVKTTIEIPDELFSAALPVAREGAFNKLSPALGAGNTDAPSFVAAEAATAKWSERREIL